MKDTTDRTHIILAMAVFVILASMPHAVTAMPADRELLRWSPPLPNTLGRQPPPEVVPMAVWDERLVPWPRRRPHRTWRRWLRRWLRRRHAGPGSKRQPRVPVGPVVLPPAVPKRPTPGAVWRAEGIASAGFPLAVGRRKRRHGDTPPPASTEASSGRTKGTDPTADPLADLRQRRGWVDRVSQAELWETLARVRWPQGVVCPHCGERDRQYLELFDESYRGGLGRWRCQVCAEAGDPGEGGTFTLLTGTIFAGMRIDARTLWLIVERFAEGKASVNTAQAAGVHRHTTDRMFRLLRAAIYQTRSGAFIALGPEDIVECDEVYPMSFIGLTAGLKGSAGGLSLERDARKRGLKRRGRGTWDSDRLPVFGLLCRGGQVRLFVLRNVQTVTIRPIVHQLVARGARVYTDSYCIYNFLSGDGYQHRAVNHGAGQYALDLDGDGKCEVHCNTMENTWSWLRQAVRTYRGVSKVYLPLYVAQFEFFFNRRHQDRWNRTLDVLVAAFQVEASSAADLLAGVQTAQFAEVCPVAG